MLHLQIGEDMQQEIDQRQQGGQRMAVLPERHTENHSTDTHTKIELQARFRAQLNDDGILASQPVVIPVTEVIHNQQRIDYQATGHRCQEHLPAEGV